MISEFEKQIKSFCKDHATEFMTNPPNTIKNRLDVLRDVLIKNPLPVGEFTHLWVNSEESKYWLPLEKSISIGADEENSLCLKDEYISTRHCDITNRDNRWYINDQDSTNGVFVNGERIRECVLKDGDIIQLGGCSLIYVSPSA